MYRTYSIHKKFMQSSQQNSANFNELSYCWLSNRIENISDKPQYFRSIKSIQLFRIFWKALIPTAKFSVDQFEKFYQTYTNELKDNWELYKFNLLTPNKKFPIQIKLNSDLKRTIGKQRTDQKIGSLKDLSVDAVLQWFSQMLIFIEKRTIKYMQGFCDLLMPIFHVFFQGLLAINDALDFTVSDPDKYIGDSFPEIDKNSYDFIAITACACSCFAFQGLMISSLHFSDQFPQTNLVDQSMEILKEKLKQRHEFEPFVSKEEYAPKRFAMRWFLLLFTQDLEFSDTIDLWYEFFRPDSVFKTTDFRDKVIKACESAAIILYKSSGDKITSHFIESMQQTKKLTFAEMRNVIASK